MKQLLAKLVILGFLSLSAANVMAADGLPITIALPELPADQEMLVLEINLEPGGQGSPPHRHNAHVFVYVLEGTVNMQVAGEEMVTLSSGEMFYENPDSVHTVSRNASDTEAATILVNMVRTVGTPVSVPVE
jgi:quercetin dioxygenase-like cupin family protein